MPTATQWYVLVSTGLYLSDGDTARPALFPLLDHVPALPPGVYISLTAFFNFLYGLLLRAAEPRLFLQHLQEASDYLAWLGFFARWEAPEGPAFAVLPGWTEVANDKDVFPWEDQFIVQPNFEVLAGRQVRPDILLELANYADLVQAHQVRRFAISQASLYRAWAAGRSAEEAVEFLRRHSKYQVPENVVTCLLDWGRRMGRVDVVRAAVVRCAGPELAAELESDKKSARTCWRS